MKYIAESVKTIKNIYAMAYITVSNIKFNTLNILLFFSIRINIIFAKIQKIFDISKI